MGQGKGEHWVGRMTMTSRTGEGGTLGGEND